MEDLTLNPTQSEETIKPGNLTVRTGMMANDEVIVVDPSALLDLDESDSSDDNLRGATSSTSTVTSYSEEWERLFEGEEYMRTIRRQALKGNLRSSRFRSICWRLYLDCLPEDQDCWERELEITRDKYCQIKEKYLTDPYHECRQNADLLVNNPLSQEAGSPWNQYFHDNELRQLISQDVRRTFPEIEFFQTKIVQNMMINILFCHARENEMLHYKQGMHELLAPLIFVLHCDHQAFLHAMEIESPLVIGPTQRVVLRQLLNPNFIEHDAFTMFTLLMETTEPWYINDRPQFAFPAYQNHNPNAQPFEANLEDGVMTPIVKKLNRIQEHILKKHDLELYHHLVRLEISPQLYGIRWIRLLFGREFPLQDILVLWDAIFADSCTLDLVDYLFVTMLIFIKDMLISSDYPTCMKALMSYPSVGDVQYLIDHSLYLRNPKDHKKPAANYQLLSAMRGTDYRQRKAPKKDSTGNRMAANLASLTKKMSGVIVTKTANQKPFIKSISQPAGLDHVNLVEALPSHARVQMEAVTPGFKSLSHFSTPRLKKIKPTSKKDFVSKEDFLEQQQQLSVSLGRLSDLQALCQYCSTKLEIHLDRLQEELSGVELGRREDDTLLAIAGCKQVRDMLKGTLKFLPVESEEIVISDNHYPSEMTADAGPTEMRLTERSVGGPAAAAEVAAAASASAGSDFVMVEKGGQNGESGGSGTAAKPVKEGHSESLSSPVPSAPGNASSELSGSEYSIVSTSELDGSDAALKANADSQSQ